MKNDKILMWGVVGVLALGLSGCNLDGSSPQEQGYSSQEYSVQMDPNATVNTPKKSSAAADSVQKSPGPKRTAAPQLPVIQ